MVLTKRDILIKSVLSIFCGYLAAVLCEIYNLQDMGKLLVPVATLLGESITIYLIKNWTRVAKYYFPSFFPEKK